MPRYEKTYVAVTLYVDIYGKMSPVAIDWETGRKFEIERVVSERNSPPEHVGAILTRRYDVIIGGMEKTLYLEMQTNKWFVERLKS